MECCVKHKRNPMQHRNMDRLRMRFDPFLVGTGDGLSWINTRESSAPVNDSQSIPDSSGAKKPFQGLIQFHRCLICVLD